MSTASVLYRFVALREDYPAGTCWAWVESAGRACGKPEGAAAHLCGRHEVVARRKGEALVAKEQARTARLAALAPGNLAKLRADLERVEAEMNRRDPQPVTTDRAAYSGEVHPSIVRTARRRLSDSNVQRMAELVTEAERLRRNIAAAESWAS